MLHYDAGTIKVVVQGGAERVDLGQVPADHRRAARRPVQLHDQRPRNGNLVFSASYGASNRSITTAIPQPFRGATVRFQAGAYQQGESSSGATDGARITFYHAAGTSHAGHPEHRPVARDRPVARTAPVVWRARSTSASRAI